tara:strand:+ start:126841 stop:130008 length:3168 start_codon:yes stop_codon:yes gene_type:complete
MDFDKVTALHIQQAIEDFEENGLPNGFGPSSTYDVLYNGKKYPPKAIMAYANYHAEGRKIERYFKGGEGTDCFKAFEKNGFDIAKKNKKLINEKLYSLKQEFLSKWPIEKLERMTLEEYTNIEKTSFCYWIEHITRDLGSIVGGSSYKFGIYKRSNLSNVKEEGNRITDGDYAWYKKYGEDNKEQAFETVRDNIVQIAKSAQSNTLELIDAIDLGNAYRWKIAFLYGDFNVLNAFKLDALCVIASNLDIKYTNKTPISKFHKAILNLKPVDKDYFSWSNKLWKQYEDRLIDVRKDFAKWLNTNTYESYRTYLGNTTKSIEDKLDEINSFFDDVDFFLVDPNKVNGLVSTILFLLSKKERLKNPDFIEYDTRNSNGIPKAILGKNNYIKFLTEKFAYKAPNYWVFQGDPNDYNIMGALKSGHLKSWKVSKHKNNIKKGDQVILWQTGNKAGCYALAEVTSEVGVFELETVEKQYYLNPSSSKTRERVKIKILKRLVDVPIFLHEIKDDPVFSNFNEGNQGTNFRATEEEYNTISNLIDSKMERNKNNHDVENVFPLNQILYGPPGTGKTYQTISKAIAIVNPNFDLNQERSIIKEEYSRLVKEGLIVFTTFHQSMAYEDFVEGIKPVLNQSEVNIGYEIQSGIFKSIAEKAKGIQGDIKSNSTDVDFRNCNYFKMSIGGKNRKDVHDWCIANNKVAIGYGENNNLNILSSKDWKSYKTEFNDTFPDLVELSTYSITATHAFKNTMKKGDVVLISLGNHIIDAIGVIKGDYEYIDSSEIKYHHFRDVEWIATDLDANPSLFVDKGISQQTIYQFNNDDIKIDYLEGISSKKINPSINQNYVLIIDEINRGNVSAIFGELITLLEEDKRKGNEETLSVILPYSKEAFSVPKNLHIIGTMNTADRSVEALDTALRRRFEFKEVMPNYNVLDDVNLEGISLSEVLKTINKRIEVLIDRDHTIGHSYFLNVATEQELANVFNNKIVPLLQEYFYGDYGKIGLVLGKGFVEKINNNSIEFASFGYENENDFKIATFNIITVSKQNIHEAISFLLVQKEVTIT